MSTRHLRRFLGPPSIPTPDESDEEFEPLSSKVKPTFSCLDVEESNISDSVSEEEEQQDEAAAVIPKKYKNKSKYNKSRKQTDDVDEIERSLREVNAKLGEPEPAPAPPVEKPVVKTVMTINPLYLDFEFELEKRFGPDEDEDGKTKKRPPPNLNRLLRRPIIIPIEKYPSGREFTGITMSVIRREGDIVYFAFDHDPRYQRFVRAVNTYFANNMGSMHAMLEYADLTMGKRASIDCWLRMIEMFFEMDKSNAAKEGLESLIAYFQYLAPPEFNLNSLNIRLEYNILENRPYYNAMIKFMHLLTNKALHRSAMEIGKVLLNLEPTDPLGITLFLDSIAIRAREFEWLVEAVEEWEAKRHVKLLYNIQYTYAMATFHVLRRKKADVTPASKLLRDAIIRFPTVVPLLAQAIGTSTYKSIKDRALYDTFIQTHSSKLMQFMCSIFAKYVGSRWREQTVTTWFLKVVNDVADEYDNDKQIQADALAFARSHQVMFRAVPKELWAHLHVVRCMGTLILDDAFLNLPQIPPPSTRDAIDRYHYETQKASVAEALRELKHRLRPHPDPEDDDEEDDY